MSGLPTVWRVPGAILNCMDARTEVPAPANEPVHEFAPHSAERARLTAALHDLSTHLIDLPHVIGGRHRLGDGERIDVVQPHRHVRLGTLSNGTVADAMAAIEAAMTAKHELGRDPVRRPGRGLPQGGRPAGRPVARTLNAATMLGQSKTALPGRDRRGLRADRLLALQRRIRPPAPGRAAGSAPGAWNRTGATARSRASSTPSPRSTSPRSPATCRPRPR